MAQQTSVEFILFELSKLGLLPYGVPEDIHIKAKQMEKEQNKRVYNEGYRDAERECGWHGDKDISEYNNAEQYSLPGVNDAKVIKSSPNFIKENSQHSSIKKK